MDARILRGLRLLLPALLLVCAVTAARAATIAIINNDAAGEGFNDPTAAAPVGGNPGTTIGQQRLNVFQQAAAIWGSILPSNVTILINATFDPLSCTATSAEADKLAGADLNPGQGDITARFNSNLGNTGCLTGSYWYYGFDNNHGTNVDLLVVLLHEMGHGLGFQTYANGTTGAMLNGYPDVFLKNLHDATANLNWDQMTNAQRAASALNTYKLLWNGPNTRGRAPEVLQLGRPALTVNAPSVIAGDLPVGTASFGPALTSPGVTGAVVLADDGVAPGSDACTPLVNGAQLAGRIALVDRGTCAFTVKVKACQDAGAIAVIVADNAAGSPPAGMGGADPTIVIPSVRVTQADGNALKAQLANGLNVTMGVNTALYAGADPYGRVMMYAPNPYQGGSSVSHWDVSCTPNLVMEPAINSDLTTNLDLTPYLMEDIGWGIGRPVATTLSFFTAEGRTDGVLLRWEFTDAAGVGSIGVERAPAATGPWSPVPIEVSTEGTTMRALDRDVEPGQTWFYRLQLRDGMGHAVAEGLVSASRLTLPAASLFLAAPAPNPTAGGTLLSFRIGKPEFVRLTIADASGRKVRTLQQGMMPAGEYTRAWDGLTDHLQTVPAGVYFVSLGTSEGVRIQRVAIVR